MGLPDIGALLALLGVCVGVAKLYVDRKFRLEQKRAELALEEKKLDVHVTLEQGKREDTGVVRVQRLLERELDAMRERHVDLERRLDQKDHDCAEQLSIVIDRVTKVEVLMDSQRPPPWPVDETNDNRDTRPDTNKPRPPRPR